MTPQNEGPLPSFFVVGAQKCATTWTHHCLRAHPQLFLPSGKVEDYYMGGEVYRTRGFQWFKDRFVDARDGQVLGDTSVDYSFDGRALLEIQALVPDRKAIMILRDPIDRARSAYFWSVRQGLLPREPLEGILSSALDEARAWVEDPSKPTTLVGELVLRGLYPFQVSRLEETFPEGRLHLDLFENVGKEPERVLERFCDFLGVDPDFFPPVARRRPKAAGPLQRDTWVERLAWKAGAPGHVFLRLGRIAREGLSLMGMSSPPVSLAKDLREELREFFSGSYEVMDAVRRRLAGP